MLDPEFVYNFTEATTDGSFLCKHAYTTPRNRQWQGFSQGPTQF